MFSLVKSVFLCWVDQTGAARLGVDLAEDVGTGEVQTYSRSFKAGAGGFGVLTPPGVFFFGG